MSWWRCSHLTALFRTKPSTFAGRSSGRVALGVVNLATTVSISAAASPAALAVRSFYSAQVISRGGFWGGVEMEGSIIHMRMRVKRKAPAFSKVIG